MKPIESALLDFQLIIELSDRPNHYIKEHAKRLMPKSDKELMAMCVMIISTKFPKHVVEMTLDEIARQSLHV